MRPDRVVVPPPAINDDLCLLQRIEDLAIQKLISKLRVETLTIAILLGAAGHGVGGFPSHLPRLVSRVSYGR